MQINGFFDIAQNENYFENCDCSYFETDKYSFSVVGEDSEKATEILKSNFVKANYDIIKKIDSLFIAVVYNKQDKTLHIFSDLFSSGLNLYYTSVNDKFYYSTSLKWLLTSSKIERDFDRNGLDEFLINGFIHGKQTLIKNVEKLTAGAEIIADKSGFRHRQIEVTCQGIDSSEAKDKLMETLQSKIVSCVKNEYTINMPISGGYDSNLILCTLASKTDNKIKTFTVGEDNETNESVRVRQNMKTYKDVELNTSFVTNDVFDSFADIVWRLDGCVY